MGLRTCQSLHECCVCGEDITLGQRYRDGGYRRRAHESCADKDGLAEPQAPVNDIWKDPNVKERLKEGVSADAIMVMDCPKCGRFGYYNEGSHFSCRFCNRNWVCLTESESIPEAVPSLRIHEHVRSLADTITVTTDGYANKTLPPAA